MLIIAYLKFIINKSIDFSNEIFNFATKRRYVAGDRIDKRTA